ncbi:MAG: hypothetical protein WC554_10485 [Clostridia bacterium]
MAWSDPPTWEQEKAIGRLARALGIDVERYYPIATSAEARRIQYELLKALQVKNIRRTANKISKKIVEDD